MAAATVLHVVAAAFLRPPHSLPRTKAKEPRLKPGLAFPHLYDNKLPVLGRGYGVGNRSFITCYVDPSTESRVSVLGVSQIKEKCSKWQWKGRYSINYFVSSSSSTNPPLLLVHGFGASIPHWRRNIDTLAQDYTVYAIDLLGFGASDKPQGFSYSMEAWAELILDFLNEVVQKPTVLIGNSVGSLACVIAASESVDDELVEIINGPANDEGALDAFVSIITGPPGPNPVQLMPRINLPVLVLWGDQDPFTPIDGPVGKYFSSLPSKSSNVSLYMLEGVGHCPHDDKPDLVHQKLLPWLAQVTAL